MIPCTYNEGQSTLTSVYQQLMRIINGILGNPREESSLMDEACEMCTLTKTQRFYGFGISFVVGFLFSIISTFFLWSLDFTSFAILYTLGNIISLISTGFIVGPTRQLKNMFDPVRIWATVVFFGCMALTLFLAIGLQSWVAIFSVILQFLALMWYSASYIPYGRSMIKKCVGNACGDLG
jgi:hypothetical protein